MIAEVGEHYQYFVKMITTLLHLDIRVNILVRSGVVVTFIIILALNILREIVLLNNPVLFREEVRTHSCHTRPICPT